MVGFIVTNILQFSQAVRPISWGEMDAFGHLNNVHYFRYMEDARIKFLDDIDFFKEDLLSVILKNECDYKAPVIYPDQILTRSYVTHIGNTSFIMLYEMYSESQEKVVAVGQSVIVLVDSKTFIKQSISSHLKNRMSMYMAQFPYGETHDQIK